jgi:hypothetical protein
MSEKFRPRVKTWLAIALLLPLALAACSSSGSSTGASSEDDDAEYPGYVGTVEGTNAFVGIIATDNEAGDNEAVVYVCDGDDEIREWFSGAIDDPASITMVNEGGGSVDAVWSDNDGGSWSGEVTLNDGSTHAFTTELAEGNEGGPGIYEVYGDEPEAEEVWAVWVIDNDGNERGAALRRGKSLSPTPTFQRGSVSFGGSTFTTTQFVGMNGYIGMNG